VLTYDALNTYVADRQQDREQAATTARTGRLLRRARLALGATGPTGSANVTPVSALTVSSPVAPATSTDPTRHPGGVGFADTDGIRAGATGSPARVPAPAVLRTAASAGTPAAHDPAAA